MAGFSWYMAFTGALAEQANNALWQKAAFRKNRCRYRWSYYWIF